MNRISILFLIIILFIRCNDGQNNSHSKRTIETERSSFYEKLITETIESALQSKNQNKWAGAFWGMGLAQYRSNITDHFFEEHINLLLNFEPSIQRGFLEVLYGLYPEKYQQEIQTLIDQTDNLKIFAMMCHYIIRNDTSQKAALHKKLMKKFSSEDNKGILTALGYDLMESPRQKPSLKDLVRHNYSGNPVIFSFQRKNRDYQGLSIIRKANGEFVCDDNGKIFSIPHLARSCSALPSYITNGNSPQGIYAIVGTDKSDNIFIGPTETLQIRMPFETDLKNFNKLSENTQWSESAYKQLLPESWQNYTPIFGAFLAGEAGRSEIILHGTTINPEYYKHLPFYPNTPSLGCITATEIWDRKTGELIHSNQQALIHAWKRLKSNTGYFILVEIDDRKQDVTLQEILPWTKQY